MHFSHCLVIHRPEIWVEGEILVFTMKVTVQQLWGDGVSTHIIFQVYVPHPPPRTIICLCPPLVKMSHGTLQVPPVGEKQVVYLSSSKQETAFGLGLRF